MPKVSLPFYKAGAEFDAACTLKELEDYEKSEAKILRKPGGGGLQLLRLRTDFLAGVLSRDAEEPVTIDVKASEVHAAVEAIWVTQALGLPHVPLVRRDADSKSGKPDESASPSHSGESVTQEALPVAMQA